MKKTESIKSFYVFKNTRKVDTEQGPVELEIFTVSNPSCYYNEYAQIGDKVKFVAGKKVPKGTEGVVKYTKPNLFEHQQDPLTGEYFNPSVLLTLNDGTEVWTSGKNLVNTSPKNSIAGPFYFTTEDEAAIELSKKPEFKTSETFWHVKNSKIFHELPRSTDAGFEIQDRKDFENEIAFVLKDTRTLGYSFLVIKKVYKPGNTILFERNTSKSNYSDVKKTFDDYVKSKEGK